MEIQPAGLDVMPRALPFFPLASHWAHGPRSSAHTQRQAVACWFCHGPLPALISQINLTTCLWWARKVDLVDPTG